MTNRKIRMGVLAIMLTFGLQAAGYGQALDGTWVDEGKPNDPDLAWKLNNGKIDSGYLRGTYTTRNNEITITVTHYIGAYLGGTDLIIFGISNPLQWYSREQVRTIFRNSPLLMGVSDQDINEMLDIIFLTETVPIIGGNKFTFDNKTFLKRR